MIVTGTIVQGKHLGRTLGFPTANLEPDTPETALLRGVYAGELSCEGFPQPMPCMVNIGRHPTVPDGAPTIEAHILDFDGNLYGRHASVELLRYLRPEQQFPSLKELRNQLKLDRLAVRTYFATEQLVV